MVLPVNRRKGDKVLASDLNDISVQVNALVSGGAVAWGSITGTLSSQADLVSALDAKVPLTRTVNTKPLSSDVVLTTADIADSSNKRYVTDAHLTLLGNTSGTNTGDQDLSGLVPNTRTVNGHALNANVTVTKGDVGLGNADNTSDAGKPVSTAQQTALDLKANLASPTFTGTVGGISKSMVGLGNVDNTSDASKPVSTATQTALDLKQSLSEKGQNNGYASLDGSGKVPSAQLPSYVDDAVEVADFASLPGTGVAGIIYVTLDDNKIWRWSGSAYIEISPSPGSTASVPDSTNKRYVTDAQLVVIGNTSGTNTGDQDLSGLVPNTRTINGQNLSANRTFTQDDIGDGTTYKQFSTTEKSKLAAISGTNTGDQDLSSYATKTGAETLTNKRITQRVYSHPTPLTFLQTVPALNADSYDVGLYDVTAAGASNIAAPTGTPVVGDKITYSFYVTSSNSFNPNWDTAFQGTSTTALPGSTNLTTSASQTVEFWWNGSKWRLVDAAIPTAAYRSGGTDVAVADGGTGRSTSTTAYGLIAAGTTATGAHQTISPGTSGQFLKSAGTSALGAFATIAESDVTNLVTDLAAKAPLASPTFTGTVSGITAAMVSAVPTTRTVNTKALSADITLNQDEVLDGTTYKQYSNTEKTKLAGIASGATANSSDATLLARANHTGTQALSTISITGTPNGTKFLRDDGSWQTVSASVSSIVGVSSTTAEFNTALSDNDFATLAGTETLSGKTLTAPRIVNNGFVADQNGNEAIQIVTTASAVNHVKITPSATGNQVTVGVTGDDAVVDLNLGSWGGGSKVKANSVEVVGVSTIQTLTNKDLTSGNTFPTFNQNTTGSAAKWTTARNLAGNSVDGSANVNFANKFIVQGTTDTGLSAAQFLGALGTGIVKNTTTTGVLSIAAAGTDYVAPGGALGIPSSGTLTNVSGLVATTGLTATGTKDATTFLRGDNTWAAPSVSSIVGITGTKAQFNTAVTDGDIVYTGSIMQSDPQWINAGIKSANYTANVNEIVAVDASAGAVQITLPNAPAAGSQVFVKANNATNAATVVTQGSDVWNISGGATSQTLYFNNYGIVATYYSGIWYQTSIVMPVGQLDARYLRADTTAQTIQGKRITKRTFSTASTTSWTIDSDSYDAAKQTALAGALTVNAPSGTPTDFQQLAIRIKDNGTARAISWNAIFRAIGVTLPTTTVLGKYLRVSCEWNATDSKWDVLAVAQEA